jgi:hypothetical protein
VSSSSQARSIDPDKSRARRQVMVAEQVAKPQTEKQGDRAADWKKELVRQTAAESEHHVRQSTHHLRPMRLMIA